MEIKESTFTLLQKRYPASEYALMKEVSDAAGFSRSSSADYVVMGLWPSRGNFIEGFEEKASRSDWLREYRNHKKCENIFQYCDYFWLITTDETIAKMEEIPETWGWLTIKNNKIYLKKEAPRLTPKNLSKSFIACMLKRAADRSEYTLTSEIKNEIEKRAEQKTEHRKREDDRRLQDFEKLKQKVREFESASGVSIEFGWRLENSAKLVKLLDNNTPEEIRKDLTMLSETANRIKDQLDKTISELTELAND